jgi:hypothetical protein
MTRKLAIIFAIGGLFVGCEADSAPLFDNHDTGTQEDAPPDSVPPTDSVDPGWSDTTPDTTPDGPDVAPEVPPDDVFEEIEPDEPGSGIVGDPCSGPGDCTGIPGGTVECVEEIDLSMIGMGSRTLPGGYCSSSCTSDGDCGGSASCVNMVVRQMCLKPCTSDGDCRTTEGYSCQTLPYVGGEYCMGPIL